MKAAVLWGLMLWSAGSQAQGLTLEECTDALGIGIYQSVVEEQCGMSGEVSSKLQWIYDQGQCDAVVTEALIEQLVAQVITEISPQIEELGTEGFCQASNETYQQLAQQLAGVGELQAQAEAEAAAAAAREEALREQAMRDAQAGLLTCYTVNCRNVAAIEMALREAWMRLRDTPYDDMCFDSLQNFVSLRQSGFSDYDLGGDDSWFAACNTGLRNSR